ncbi:MAG: SMP-30/gluconolactonase/LRE family protein, partial [Mycobacteriaceae bacterium]|nr:SMP-30/gluconolactonase/LRE family protein [Mycobacteriaceae bacterium]
AHVMDRGIAIANSTAWSPDDRTMYFADTLEQVIYAYDFDPARGDVANRRVFASTAGQTAAPDGSTVDTEGFLWNAQWGAFRLARYAPDGRLDRVVPLPVRYPTSCSFGGPDLGTLYVTSAVWDLTPEQRAREPWAGGVLALRPGERGLPEPRFRG